MLQYQAKTNTEYSIAEQVQMAIEGGCAWVNLSVDDLDDAQVREMAPDIISMCRDSQTILTIDDRIELAKELAIHGVLLAHPKVYGYAAPAAVREALGPEAIIGVKVDSPEAIQLLAGLDIDYAVIEVDKLPEGGAGADQWPVPVVAAGNIVIDHISEVLARGAKGIMVGHPILEADDPVEEMRRYIAATTGLQK